MVRHVVPESKSDPKEELYLLLVRAEAIAVEEGLSRVAELLLEARFLVADDND